MAFGRFAGLAARGQRLAVARQGLMRLGAALAGIACLSAAAAAQGAEGGTLFAEPFAVVHSLIQDDGAGNRFETEPVKDHYFGSWIVSERADGSRMVVDLARRELTEIRPELGTWWSLSFDRHAELQRRLAELEGDDTSEPDKANVEVLDWQVVEVPAGAEKALAGGSVPRRFSIRAEGAAESAEVWIDPSLRASARALDALAGFEATLAGGADKASSQPPVDAARRLAGGALVVRSVRQRGDLRIEDVGSKVEKLARMPRELAEVPEGLVRVASPLEQIVSFLEEERRREQHLGRPALGGGGAGE